MHILYLDNGLTGEALAQLRNQAGWGHTPVGQATTAIAHTLFSVAAMDGDDVVGMGRLVGDGALNWYVQDLIVLPNYQNNGIGSTILQKLIDHATHSAQADTTITIGLMSAKGKENYYQKFGFRTRPNDNEGAGMVLNKRI